MHVGLLGPLEASVEGRPVALGGGKPRSLLAILALNAGTTVSMDRLIDGLWGDHPPASAAKMVQLYVSQLRKALGAAGRDDAIATRGHGYELRLDAADVDVRRFEELVSEGAPREALRLWRGPALDDVSGEPFAAAEVRRLDELRLDAAEAAIDLDLQAGRHREVLGELLAHAGREPLRERVQAQLMLALYRSGRQADALEAYRRARDALVGQIGAEPGLELRRLHEAILNQDPSLSEPLSVGEWARAETMRRISVDADRAAMERAGLAAAEADLAGSVAELQAGAQPRRHEPGDAEVVACPFKGLASFDVDDADWFFGRERLVAEMVARLAGAPLLGVVGPSGSGKSSALRAGLLPALAAGVLPGSDGWTQALLRPGEHPLRALEEATRQAPAGGRIVVIVDQCEELFTACRDESERAAFVAALVACSADPRRRTVVLVALRADFYGHCAAYPELARLLGAAQVLVGPMRRGELRRAIELPARRAGLEIEPDLTDALIADVEGQPGGLPLLSTALLELWQQRDGRRLRLGAYEHAGGVQGAVARLAEGVYQRLDPDRRRTARAILLRLAGDGEGDAAVCARVPLDEFDDDAAEVLGELADQRLITVTEGEVEVAHEALLREWPRLRGWLEDDAQGRRRHRHLRAAAKEWGAGGPDAPELYRDARLAAALDWAADHASELTAEERAFLGQSRAASERSHRRLQGVLVSVVGLLVLAVVAGFVALEQRGSARDQATVADAQRLGARALVDKDLDRALLLARQGVALDDSAATRGNLLAALLRSPAIVGVIAGDGERKWATDLSPDAGTLAVGSHFGQVHLYDMVSRRLTGTLEPTPESTPIANLAFSPDGTLLAVAHDTPAAGNVLAIVDMRSGRVIRRMTPPRYRLATGLAWSDARTLDVIVSKWPDQHPAPALFVRYDARTGRRLRGPVPVNRRGQSPVMLTSDRRRMVTVGDSETTVRDTRTLRTLRRFAVGAVGTSAAGLSVYALSPDGDTLLIGDEDGSVRLLDLRTGRTVKASGRHGAAVSGARFSPDGGTVVTTGDDGQVIVWDVGHAALEEMLSGPSGGLFSPQITPDGGTLYTAAADGTLFVWDLDGARRLGRRFTAGAGDLNRPQAALSSDGRVMAVGQDDGSISLVDPRTLMRRAPFPVVDTANRVPVGVSPFGKVLGIGFVPGSHLLVVGGHHGFLALVDTDRRQIVRRLVGHRGLIWTPGISADGRLLVTGSDDRTVRFWSLPDGRPLGRPLRFPGVVSDAQVSPDGRWATVVVLSANNLVGTLQVWDVRTRRRVQGVSVQAGIEQVRFSPDGRRLIVGTSDGRTALWSTSRWAPSTRAFADGVSAAISPDGRTLATGGGDGAVRLWDIRTRQALGAPLPGEPERQVVPYFTPDGRYLIASHETGRAYRWDIRPDSLARQACRVAGRQLTRAEWAESLPGRDYDPAC